MSEKLIPRNSRLTQPLPYIPYNSIEYDFSENDFSKYVFAKIMFL